MKGKERSPAKAKRSRGGGGGEDSASSSSSARGERSSKKPSGSGGGGGSNGGKAAAAAASNDSNSGSSRRGPHPDKAARAGSREYESGGAPCFWSSAAQSPSQAALGDASIQSIKV